MDRTAFFNELIPSKFTVKTEELSESGPQSRKVYNNKPKDIKFIKRVTREKVNLDGSPIKYYAIDTDSDNNVSMGFDNSLKDHSHLVLEAPIDMIVSAVLAL